MNCPILKKMARPPWVYKLEEASPYLYPIYFVNNNGSFLLFVAFLVDSFRAFFQEDTFRTAIKARRRLGGSAWRKMPAHTVGDVKCISHCALHRWIIFLEMEALVGITKFTLWFPRCLDLKCEHKSPPHRTFPFAAALLYSITLFRSTTSGFLVTSYSLWIIYSESFTVNNFWG